MSYRQKLTNAWHMLRSLLRLISPHRGNNGDFRRHRRYRLQVVNLLSLSPVVEARMRPAGIAGSAIAIFLAIGAVWVAALIYTPMRNLLPTKMQAELRNDYAHLSAQLDSILAVVEANDRFAHNLRAALSDTIDSPQPGPTADRPNLPLDSLIEATAAERSFVTRFEDSERFNLSVLSPIAAEGMTFYPPVPASAEPRVTDTGIPYQYYAAGKSTPVSAVYRGTVTNCYFATGKGITIVVQHPNDFLSVYSGLAQAFVTKGEKVLAGQRLGLAIEGRYPLTFELWHNGSPLPPGDYITVNGPIQP